MSGPNAEAASLGEDIPCAAGVRGDGPCSFELCPPGIGCRRVREQRRQGGGGAVLGEEARVRLAAVIFRGDPAFAADAEEVLSRIEPVVAALVEQARAEGSAEERERCAKRIEGAGDGHQFKAGTDDYGFKLYSSRDYARIVRSTS